MSNHKLHSGKEDKSVCEKFFKCCTCYKIVLAGRTHSCNTIYCNICHQNRPNNHLCYMPLDSSSPKLTDFLFIFYDLECTQNKTVSDGKSLHEPNLCVFNQRCEVCIDYPIEKVVCRKCGVRQQVLNMSSIIETFFQHILEIRKKFKHVIVLAHNGQAYDHQFILNYILTKTQFKPELIMRGSKIISLSINNVKLWYTENKDNIFDMQKEIVSYCISDVNILTLACLKFRELLIKSGNVCPYTEACTIASACNKLFRRNFLKTDTIGLIPRQGYRYRDNQSKVAIYWLIWEEKARGIDIVHAAKQKEIVIGGLPVDGYCPETNQVFEMMGCFYHGCVKCFKNDRDKPIHSNSYETMDLRYENTLSKINHLNQLGYERRFSGYDSYPYGYKKIKQY
ncbi:hypothetical protein PPYR_01135 [Photinus pyralis]|uniref:DNA-directed DNA polymerase n=2 Tax=Photinus pyralis TaxID=7054 RepID=A0A5N4B3K7_PHOPY|nr:hypothetical protein PPYR_01135 [Photinus pyralis]